jgi:hypothetical protein
MYRLSACLLVLCLLTAERHTANAQNQTANPREPYPPQFVRDYSNECLQTSMAEGLEEPEAKQLCQCTLDEFQKQYSLQEFKQLTAASATDKAAENSLIQVGQLCFESLLYEQ